MIFIDFWGHLMEIGRTKLEAKRSSAGPHSHGFNHKKLHWRSLKPLGTRPCELPVSYIWFVVVGVVNAVVDTVVVFLCCVCGCVCLFVQGS